MSYYLTKNKFLIGVAAGLLMVSNFAFCEASQGGGRGGPFIQFHSHDLSVFDPQIEGKPLVIGGIGLGVVSKSLKIGGAGGGGFLWNPSDNAHFGMGYGGVVGEYSMTSWLSSRLMIGGGGYSIAKVLTETDSSTDVQKIRSGGFIFFHPAINFDIPIHTFLRLSMSIGYFLPNISKLHSLTITATILFGKN